MSSEKVLYTAGNTTQILETATGAVTTLPGTNSGGVAAIAPHPSHKWFAVAEKGEKPNILIYEFPSLKVVKVLEGGTEKAYSCMAFSTSGTKLASVGSYPDYMLTVWAWEEGRTILRLKAFSQDVFHVAFAPNSDGALVTAGMGHIKFWEMARTFTGLKLKGTIGKFGKIQLSDVSAFVTLPNEKVISGTETGHLLVWDGNFIQFQLFRATDVPCHDGPVEHLSLIADATVLVSAGMDGYIRHWDVASIVNAPVSDSYALVLHPVLEHGLGPSAAIRTLIHDAFQPRSWVLDASGALVAVPHAEDFSSYDKSRLVASFHAGPLAAAAASPVHGLVAVGGDDGVLAAYAVRDKERIATYHCAAAVTEISWLPVAVDASARTVVAGTTAGTVSLLQLCRGEFVRLAHAKPHTSAVTALAVAPAGPQLLASASTDGSVFFFKLSATGLDLIGFVTAPAPVTWMAWAPTAGYVVMYTASGHFATCPSPAVLPESASFPDFVLPLPVRTVSAPAELLTAAKQEVLDELAAEEAAKAAAEAAAARAAALADDPDADPDALLAAEAEAEAEAEEDPLSLRINDRGEVILPTMEEWLAAKRAQEAAERGEAPPPVASAPGSPRQAMAPDSPASASSDVVDNADGPGPSSLDESGVMGAPGYAKALSVILRAALVLRDGSLLAAFSGDAAGYLYELTLPAAATSFGDADALVAEFQAQIDASAPDPLEVLLAGAEEIPRPTAVLLPAGVVSVGKLVEFHAGSEVSCLERSPSGHFLISGGSDGSVRVTPYASGELGAFSALYAHDAARGPVAAVVVTHDEATLCSVAPDGTLAVVDSKYGVASVALPDLVPAEVAVASGAEAAVDESQVAVGADNGDEPEQYSVYEQKLKREQAAAEAAAEVKKAKVRDQVAHMKVLYDALLEENHSAPPDEQLERAAFQLDPKLADRLAAANADKLELAQKLLEWDSRRKRLLLAKLRARFIDPIETHRIVVTALDDNFVVSTFRTCVPQPGMDEAVAEARAFAEARAAAAAEAESALALQTSETTVSNKTLDGESDRGDGSSQASGSTGLPRIKRGGVLGPAVPLKSKLELRRAKIEARERARAALMAKRPKPGFVDPETQAAIDNASATLGDYKLKSSPDYVVPEHERVNATSKGHEMVLLAAEILERKRAFNTSLLAARETKAKLIEQVRAHTARLVEIDEALGEHGEYFRPAPVNDAEYPWQVLELAESDELLQRQQEHSLVSKEAAALGRQRLAGSASQLGMDIEATGASLDAVLDLVTFKPPLQAQSGNSEAAGATSIVHSLPNLGVPAEAVLALDTPQGAVIRASRAEPVTAPVCGPVVHGVVASAGRVDAVPVYALALAESGAGPSTAVARTKVRGSDLEQRFESAKLRMEKQALLEDDMRAVRQFDALLASLRAQKFELEGVLKMAQMKMIVLYQELLLLKEFDKRDRELSAILEAKLAEQAKIHDKIVACTAALDEKEAQLLAMPSDDEWTAKFDALLESAPASIYDALWKIFCRNVRRRKRATGGDRDRGDRGGRSEASDSDSDYESDYESESGSGSESDDGEDVMPPRCEPVLFDAVLALRAERLESQDAVGAIMEERDRIAASAKSLAKAKDADSGLSAAREAIDAFQREKQSQLNELDITVSLQLDQIYYVHDGRLPHDLDDALVFSEATLAKLQARSGELRGELRELDEKKRSLEKLLAKLVKEKKAKREEREELAARAEDVQMLKFGKLIDLDHVLEMSVNKSADELKALLRAADSKRIAELMRADEALRRAKDELAAATAANTARLTRLTTLMAEQQQLERTLNVTQQHLQVAEFSNVHRKRERDEVNSLRRRIRNQEAEAAKLRSEIRTLSLK
ncbi:WD repeat domain 52 [Thecamonas trahens ATCC 50062]|uniref:WD repeat domain 52 n=1 Tax=Thecamonas trahens ATCC 50062 TaxID=461836 RepID=A0A0L0DDV1_THETB|nr:WD repeat domain 52 [Thecamonas trahens ATCC 50062]KNC50512.1 WD repeat domain 52 [Thecamonas trahens ATCC 50062]|eukprot:XP_013762404.1 WD repeat domain 52 [Thecamonas trahens ATCC 50062]